MTQLSWREQVEQFFGSNHVVKGDRLLNLVTTGNFKFEGSLYPGYP